MTRITLNTVTRSLPFICFGIVAVVVQSPVFGQAHYTTPFTFTTIAGSADSIGSSDGTNSAARFYEPLGIVIDGATNIYVSDYGNDTIRKLTPIGKVWIVTTIAGLRETSGSADGTNGAARFNDPGLLALDNATNLYLADYGNDTIRKISPVGTNWVVTTIAGLAAHAGSADGPGSVARFHNPTAVALDGATNVYVADSYNNTIRELSPVGTNWVVTTLAGRAGFGGSADGTGNAARFDAPDGVAVDGATNLYVADSLNNTIRKMTQFGSNWAVTTIAGLPGISGSADGANRAARFNQPAGVAVDGASNIYVADWLNCTIRRVTPVGTNWVVTTLAGMAPVAGSANGTGSAARFNSPNDLAVDGAGNVFVPDTGNDTIREGTPPNVLTISGPSIRFNGGQFGFALNGLAGQTVVVDASSDLENWSPIWTNILTFPASINFTDSDAATDSIRFYRARTP